MFENKSYFGIMFGVKSPVVISCTVCYCDLRMYKI